MEHPLKQYRLKTGVSAAKVAQAAGTTRQTISRIEKGNQTPSLRLVARIVDATDGAVAASDFIQPATSERQ